MLVKAVKTRPFLPPKDDLLSLIKESFSGLKLKEKSIIVITSKIVAIWQGRCVKMDEFPDKPRTFLSEKNNKKSHSAFLGKVRGKDELIKQEAEFYLDRDKVPGKYVMLTIKQNLLIPTAGIDESNANGYYILWPKDSYKTAREIYNFIKKNYGDRFESAGTKLLFGLGGVSVAGTAQHFAPGLVAAGGGIAAGLGSIYQTVKVFQRIKNSPTLARYYGNVLKASAEKNTQQMIQNMEKLDKALAFEEKKEKDLIEKLAK